MQYFEFLPEVAPDLLGAIFVIQVVMQLLDIRKSDATRALKGSSIYGILFIKGSKLK